jgi:hypothetical protein
MRNKNLSSTEIVLNRFNDVVKLNAFIASRPEYVALPTGGVMTPAAFSAPIPNPVRPPPFVACFY